jgi:hypothetical protein
VGGFPKEPANNPQSLRVKPPKYRNSFSFAGSFAGYCNSIYDKCVDQPANNLRTTRERKFRFAKCGKSPEEKVYGLRTTLQGAKGP